MQFKLRAMLRVRLGMQVKGPLIMIQVLMRVSSNVVTQDQMASRVVTCIQGPSPCNPRGGDPLDPPDMV